MEDQQHLALLKQGTDAWNRWKQLHSDIRPDLSVADLSYVDLRGADLNEVDLVGANLYGANLSGVHLRDADLRDANLSEANLSGANLRGAYLVEADLTGTNLSETDLYGANFSGVDLSGADLMGADLIGANLSEAYVAFTIFRDVDLSEVKGLETVRHAGPSTIGIDTIYRSRGHIPEVFLREAGVPDVFREYMHSLVTQPIQYETCFISYSSKDEDFVKRLRADLQNKGVRCWFAPHDLRPGAIILRGIDEAIYAYDKLMLILSEHVLASRWVAHEIDMARYKELEKGSEVLFPLRIDNAILTYPEPWAKDLCIRHIADFTKPNEYEQAFAHLLYHLKAASKE
jgi:hypothetical protein